MVREAWPDAVKYGSTFPAHEILFSIGQSQLQKKFYCSFYLNCRLIFSFFGCRLNAVGQYGGHLLYYTKIPLLDQNAPQIVFILMGSELKPNLNFKFFICYGVKLKWLLSHFTERTNTVQVTVEGITRQKCGNKFYIRA